MSQRTTTEARLRYNGPAEIWVGGVKRFDVVVRLIGWVDVTEITTNGGASLQDGVTSWDGNIVGLAERDLFGMVGATLEVKLPEGGSGEAVLLNSDSYL